jgi:tripartite-type tricarboxylate transporter receptor subunit TctC
MKNMKWILTIVTILCIWISPLLAADYPDRPVNLLVGYAAGGIGDLAARALAAAAEPSLGQSIVVLNKPGATGSIMMAQLVGSKPDGYTIAFTPASLAITPFYQKVPYDLKKDFTYIAAVNTFTESITVRQDSPWKTLNDLIDYARKNPNKLRIAGSSIASSASLMVKVVAQKAGIQYTEVPFGSTAEAITALLGGHVDVIHASGDNLPLVRAGKLRMLATDTAERLKEFPNVPTLRDLGYDFVALSYCGIMGPKGLPESIAKKLENVFKKARDEKSFIELEAKMGLSSVYEIGKEFENRQIEIYNFVGTFLKK